MSVDLEISLPGLVGEQGRPRDPGISLAPSIPAETELEIENGDEVGVVS